MLPPYCDLITTVPLVPWLATVKTWLGLPVHGPTLTASPIAVTQFPSIAATIVPFSKKRNAPFQSQSCGPAECPWPPGTALQPLPQLIPLWLEQPGSSQHLGRRFILREAGVSLTSVHGRERLIEDRIQYATPTKSFIQR